MSICRGAQAVRALYRGAQRVIRVMRGSAEVWSEGAEPEGSEVALHLTDDLTVGLVYRQSAPNGVTVDWGDGSDPESAEGTYDSATGDYRVGDAYGWVMTHTYAAAGDYIVTMTAAPGVTWVAGYYDGVKHFAATSSNSTSIVTSVAFDNHVTEIAGEAFYGASNLTSITIPASLRRIGVNAFASGLQKVNISDLSAWCAIEYGGIGYNPLTRGNGYLYLNNVLVADLRIPEGTTTIKSYAFEGCKSITSIYLSASVADVQRYAFDGCENAADGYTVSSENLTYSAKDGYLLSKNGKTLFFPPPGISGAAAIPAGVETIGEYAFIGASITSIVFPASLVTIGPYSFQGSGLTGNLELSAEEIGYRAFAAVRNLENVWIRSSVLRTRLNPESSSVSMNSVFSSAASGLNIYCEPTERPSGWYEKFNYRTNSAALSTVWGQTTRPW